MQNPLPRDRFRWLKKDDNQRSILVNKLKSGKLPKFSKDTGYIIEVNLHIPKNLQQKFDEFPLAPENRSVISKELSPIQIAQFKKIYTGLDLPEKASENSKKLISDLNDKEKYVIHHQYLDLLMRNGYVVTSVDRVMLFRESKFLLPWIDHCTKSRSEARKKSDEAGSDFWKLAANAVYGKFIENVRRYKVYKICDGSAENHQKSVSKPLWVSSTYINKDMSIEEFLPKIVEFDKCLAVGLAILDISKMHMACFYYEVLKSVFGDRCGLIYTDTDSFILKLFSHGKFSMM